jgi:hypothetical protein
MAHGIFVLLTAHGSWHLCFANGTWLMANGASMSRGTRHTAYGARRLRLQLLTINYKLFFAQGTWLTASLSLFSTPAAFYRFLPFMK